MRALCLCVFQSRETLTCFLAQGQNGGTLQPLMDMRAPSRARLLVCVFTPEHLFTNSPDRSALTPPSAWSYHPIPSPGPDGSPLPHTFLSLHLTGSASTHSATCPTGIAPGPSPATHCWPASGGFRGPFCQKTNCSTAWAFMNSASRSRAWENRLRKILGLWYSTLSRKSGFF